MSVKIIFESREIVAEPHSQKTVLDLAEAQGLKLVFGCRSGSCGVCRHRVRQGLDLLEPRRLVEADTHARCFDGDDIRLVCQATFRPDARGELQIEKAPEVVIKDE